MNDWFRKLFINEAKPALLNADGGNVEVTKYDVAYHLVNCVTNNNVTSVDINGAYSCTITANDGYGIKSVFVAVNGVTQMNKTYDEYPLSVDWSTSRAFGEIVITAVADDIMAIAEELSF